MNAKFAVLLPACVLAACATVEVPADPSHEDVVYQTGTNIPSKYRRGPVDRVKIVDKEWLENEMRRTPPENHPNNTGGAMSPRGTNPF